jgi:hypothetical protein
MNSIASRPPGGAWGLVLGPGGVRLGLATTSVAACGVGLGGPVGVFSGPAGVGFARLGPKVEPPRGDAARLSSVDGVSLVPYSFPTSACFVSAFRFEAGA